MLVITFVSTLFSQCRKMLHYCIVPQCNSFKIRGLQFHRLPLHYENLLKVWLVNIRENIHINEHSRVCSVHFEDGKKKDKDLPTIFA